MSQKREKIGANPDERDLQLCNLAVNLAEKQLREGTASAQVISHYLKMASKQNELDLEKMRLENAVLAAKERNLTASQQSDEKYGELISLLKGYRGDEDYE